MITVWTSYKTIKIYDFHVLTIFYIAIALILIYLSVSPFAYRLVENYGSLKGEEQIGEALTLGFNNPNETGMILYLVITVIFSILITLKLKFKILIGVLIITLLYMLYQTGSRTCLFSLLFVVLSYCNTKITYRLLSKKYYLLVLLLAPLLFSYLYPIIALRFNYADYEILGKPIFSGRELLFLEGFSRYISHPILGDIAFFQFENSFNGYLSVMFNTGLVGLIAYIFFAYKTMKNLFSRVITRSQLFAFLSLVGVFFIACSESAILLGGGQWYVLQLTLFVIANNRINTGENKLLIEKSNVR